MSTDDRLDERKYSEAPGKEQMWQFSSFNSLFRDTPPYTFPGSPIVFHC